MKNSTLSRFLMICSLCLTLSAAHAQYVAIPDTNFGNWLVNNGYSSCLTGNSTSGFRLDTSCPAVLAADTMACRYSNIYDMTGFEYFHNVVWLDCGLNHLSTLPVLPGTLTFLNCSENPLGSLPALPVSLSYLTCDTDQLSSLPPLPAGLNLLECDSNHITSLPTLPSGLGGVWCGWNQLSGLPALPASLTNLFCQNNLLTSLPTLPSGLTGLAVDNNLLTNISSLPPNLDEFTCSSNLLTSLPALPLTSLGAMSCSYNRISSLPALPASIYILAVDHNPLYTLPALPAGLQTFICSNDSLTSIPPLPLSINYLFADSNQLSAIPALGPSLQYLSCVGNPNLSCLPQIYPNLLQFFYINGTAITCLPNNFSAISFDVNPATMPLCTPGSGCNFYYNITGNIHSDTSAGCSLDSLYPGDPITDLKVQLIYGGQVVQQFYTFASGSYTFQAPTVAGYTVSVDTTSLPLSVVCPGVDSQYVSLSAADPVATGVNFGMQCSNFDYGVGYIWGHHFRPEYTSYVHIGAGNIARVLHSIDCGPNMPGTVTTTIAGSVAYISPAPYALTPTSVSGSTLTYTLSNLDSLTWGSLDIIVMTDTNAVAGTDACFTTIITPATPDMNPNDDSLTMCFPIVHSWDPNSKSVTPTELSSGDWLTYTVEFQNTGTDTAYTVVVRDTLSQYVDASTFQYIAASSKPVIQLMGSAMVFTFPKINLVDSATNDSLSTGWIQYKVKAKGSLPDNTQISNTAYVHFDNNPAVVTNTVTSIANLAFGITEVSADNSISLYPNPNKGSFTLTSSHSIGAVYTISDMIGNIIEEKAITSSTQQIDMSDASEGVYTLTVKGSNPLRFVVVR